MTFSQYVTFWKGKFDQAEREGNKEEAIRLLALLRDTATEAIVQWEKQK